MDNDYINWIADVAIDCLCESQLISGSDDHVVISIPRSLWYSYQELSNGN